MTDPIDELTKVWIEHLEATRSDDLNELRTTVEMADDTPTIEWTIDLNNVFRSNEDLYWELRENPKPVVSRLKRAIQNYDAYPAESVGKIGGDATLTVTLTNVTDDLVIDISDDLSDHVGELVAIKGQALQVSESSPQLVQAVFVCQRCGAETVVDQSETLEIETPFQCASCEREGPFQIDYNRSDLDNIQFLSIQQSLGDLEGDSPESIDVRARTEHRTNQVAQGEDVIVTGILQIDVDVENTVLDTYVNALDVSPVDDDDRDLDLTEHDQNAIEEISTHIDRDNEGNLEETHLDVLADLFAPSIRGHSTAKQLILLQQMMPDWTDNIRGDSHILLIGDSGTGKSDLQDAARDISPLATKASGTSSTSAGLIASAEQRTLGGQEQWVAQAGALPLADGGLVTIDELDKLDEPVENLNDALESGEISFNKASIHQTLSTEAAVLAAANPQYGDWDPMQSMQSQIEFDPTVLSRFVVVSFSDSTDNDEEIVDAIGGKFAGDDTAPDLNAEYGVNTSLDRYDHPHDLVAKYVAHADEQPDPSYDSDSRAHAYIKDAYTDIRNALASNDNIEKGIKPRQIEDIIRVAMASAKARFSDRVELVDAKIAVQLVVDTLSDFGFSQTAIETGTHAPDTKKAVMDTIKSLNGGPNPRSQIRDNLPEHIDDESLDHVLNTLTNDGTLILRDDGYATV